MAGLILALCLAAGPAAAAQDPRLTRAAQRDAQCLEGLERWLPRAQAALRDGDATVQWAAPMFHLLRRLEWCADPRVPVGWELLAQRGDDVGRANWILWRRRHDAWRGAHPEREPDAGVEVHLESALASWGESDLAGTRAKLEAALRRFPLDDRLVTNLHWLDGAAPSDVHLDGDARATALAVLTLRRTRSAR